jgi:riboflavin kinase/FMN adenylyltransferase
MTLFPLALPPGFQVAAGLAGLPAALTGGAVAIGNFDGLHRGHRAVIDAARMAGQPAVALTFDPHPRHFFQPERLFRRLSGRRERLALLAQSGLDGALILPFDAAMAALSAERFVADVLVGALHAKTVAVGYNFHFGKGREGSPAFLEDAARRHGFKVAVVAPEEGDGGPVSSTAIRDLLGTGRVAQANRLLGYRWFVIGPVIHGDRRGRTLGFPTANLAMPAETPLGFGIYAVRVLVGDRIHGGVASFGRRPTFDDGAPLFEPFLFDFSGDLYGQDIAVELVAHLRGEERFADVEALVAQMKRDEAAARALLAEPEDPAAPSLFGAAPLPLPGRRC